MAAYTSARRRTGTVDISKAVNHRESAFLAPGCHDRSTIRLEVYFFLATRVNRIAGLWAINDRLKSLPPGLVRLPPRLWATRQTPRVPSDPHRPSTIDVPQNQPRSAKPLHLLRQGHGVPGRPEPLADVRSRSRVRCTSLTHTAQSRSASSTDWRQITPEVEPIVAVHANILSPAGPGLATEPPRYRRVATVPMPALVPNIARPCRFPGRGTGFGAQRGFRSPR